MTVGRVSDFNFPSSGNGHVRGYFRGGRQEPMAKGGDVKGHKPTDKMAVGGIVMPPKAGIRPPRPTSAVLAQKHAEGAALRPSRGPRIGAKLAVAKPAATPSMTPGALQSASAPLIAPPTAPPPGGMARGGRLTAKARNALPKSKFAGPGRSFPIPDKSHAGNAKARASQAMNAGRMSKSQAEKIDAKADAVLGEK